MSWLDRALFVSATVALVLTILAAVRTIRDVMSSKPAEAVRAQEEIGSSRDASSSARVWADDVLAEEEQDDRETRGAPDHSFDVCTHWDEQDERQALEEASLRHLRSLDP